jgi:hypothetical protein
MRHRVVATAVLIVLVSALAGAGVVLGGLRAAATANRTAESRPNADLAQRFAQEAPPLALPAATAPPAPAPPTLSAGPPLQPHEIFGFAPWWNLAEEQAFDVKDMTTLAYFSVDANPDGTIADSGSGWVGYESQALADLVDRAHDAGDRVVLTVSCFDQRSLDQLTSDPAAPARLGAALVQLVSAKNLDGVNFDFEGNGPRDRQGVDNLVAVAAGQLRGADPHWQVTMSTYASSAGDQTGFFDIAGLAPSVDGFFVMAYDMNDPSTPSPTSPLSGSGNVDAVDLVEYSHVVPRSKIVLGVPYYGYDWPTSGPDAGDPATGPPSPVSYAQVATQHLPSYWDTTSQTPWTAYQAGSQWHQVYYDDPTSLALKARLANADGIAGVGVWALGMDGNSPAMLAALLGHAAPAKYGSPAATGQGSSAAPGSGGTSYSYRGVWNGTAEQLEPVTSPLPGGGEARSAGHLQSFSTDDPARACLAQGPALPVYELVSSPTTYVVQTSTPAFCASGTWEFSGPASGNATAGGSGTSGGGTSSTQPPGSTTTSPPPAVTVPSITGDSTPKSPTPL